MLRKQSLGEQAAGESHNVEEDGEKDGKIQRRQRQQTQLKMILAALGIFGLFALVVTVKLKHQKYSPPTLRSRRQKEKESHDLELIDPGHFVPPDSIYKLSIEDINGKMVSLEQFHGMVTLIVNVACL